MKCFIVYDDQGCILRTGTCADNDIDLQANESQSVIEGIADDSIHMIVDGEVADKPPPVDLTNDQLIAIALPEVRRQRDTRLQESDWTQFPDSPLSDSKKTEWATYRQSLRDIPETYSEVTSLDDIIWPIQPE